MKYDVFISYSSKDQNVVEALEESKMEVDVSRKQHVPIIIMADTSRIMKGEMISSLNQFIAEKLAYIQSLQQEMGCVFEVNVLELSSSAKWIYNIPRPIDYLELYELEAHDDSPCWTNSIRELNGKLCHKQHGGFLTSYAPLILMYCAANPADAGYHEELEHLKENGWFSRAEKIAVQIGSSIDDDVLAEFTGNKEMVFSVHQSSEFMMMLRSSIRRIMADGI